MMKKKQLQAIFLYEFKLGHKAAEVIRNINSAFGQGTANERTMQRWFQKFWNEDESLEDEKGRGSPLAVELKVLVEADPRITILELAEKLDVSHPTVLDHLRQLGKSKKLDKWVSHELKIKNFVIIKCALRFFCTTTMIHSSIAL